MAGLGASGLTMRPRGVFVTGTDTGVGKTVVSAALVAQWRADYWKPAQTGLAEEAGDSDSVASLAPGARIWPPRFALRAPLSPEAAGALEGVAPALEDFTLPASTAPIVVEGAGGVLVPLGGGATMADLMVRLALPVVLAARGTLGTINHTLLSLEALRARGLHVAFVVMTGPILAGNDTTVARLGQVAVARLPWLTPLSADALAAAARGLPAPPWQVG